ncbi:MAG: insulinase family protein [Proteobacteria bacterium]|nr:insulinase family protein [Pseudomonadota bacterium]
MTVPSIHSASHTANHPAFELVEQRSIEMLELTVSRYRHRVTGAVHIHLAADHPENVFLVAFRTMPSDSTGVAHILEHTVLCGSERFPVRDPFFLMIRRSLNTFMNAFTGSDYTAYPFASQNRKDYFNLLDIYLDAAFFPKLSELDFAQEGHRLEFDVPDDPGTPIVQRGVVYNEMKGDSSSPISYQYEALQRHLYPTTTYHYNSGGDPRAIPTLKYEDLLAFYRLHYHPGNAVFMTFGNIPAAELQQSIENKALCRWQESAEPLAAGLERRYRQPLRVEESYPVDDESDDQKPRIVMAWLLGENTDLDMMLRCHLLSDYLFDTGAAPLRRALEETTLGDALSPLSGLEESNREMSFHCGLEGYEGDGLEAFEELVCGTLEQIVAQGVDRERMDAVLHQLELSQREIGGDGTPYGLQLMFSCLSAAIHGGDPVALLDLDPAIGRLRADIEDPDFLPHLIQTLLISNNHRVTLLLKPDAGLAEREAEAETHRLVEIKGALQDEMIAGLIEQARTLAARQQQVEDLSVLPRVGLEDIGPPARIPAGQVRVLSGGRNMTSHDAGTNGLVYQQIITRLPALTPRQSQLLPIYTMLLTEVGSAGRSYVETQHIQYANTGGLNAFSAVRTDRDDVNLSEGYFTISSRALADRAATMFGLVRDTWESPNLSEQQRIRDLIKQSRVRRDAGITGSGHLLAMSAAAARFRPVARLSYQLSGLGGLLALRQLDAELDDTTMLSSLVRELEQLHARLVHDTHQFLLIADPAHLTSACDKLIQTWQGEFPLAEGRFEIGPGISEQDILFTTNTQVNFCAEAHPTVPESHEDAAALSVLAGVMRNGFLHPVIREQGGAYGGGAGHDLSNGIFRLYSYRDPNLEQTFTAFDEAIDWVTGNFDASLVEEAILGVIGSMDAPGSPAGEIRQTFHNEIFGRSQDMREAFRECVLGVTAADVARVAQAYLTGEKSRAVLTSAARSETLGQFGEGFSRIQL